MAVAAEALRLDEEEYAHGYPLVIPVAELPEDELVRRRAERFIRAVGMTALQSQVADYERFAPESDLPSLKDAIQAAANGSEQACRFITMSARTDVVERTIKAGHIMKVELESDEDGYILQHGQRMTDVYANSLQLVSPGPMQRRTVVEAINGFRMVDVRQQKLLEDYAFVVLSPYPDDMTDNEADDAGFFADTKSCSIQTLREWDGKLVQESAFVAGVKGRGAERHDAAALERMLAEFGVLLEGSDATEMIATPLLIHRSLMPNGVVDLVRRYDRHAGGTFFGQAKPLQDYIMYLEKCREREAQFEPRVQGIVDTLIAEAATIKTPLDAIQRLHELSQHTMVDHAINDASIDPRVFGAEAAAHVEQARYWLEQGDYSRFLQFRDSAQETAHSSSCPAGIKSGAVSVDGEGDTEGGASRVEAESSSTAAERKKMTCPFCGDSKQYGDPCSSNQYCTKCHARVVNGKVVSKGNGGRKAAAKSEEILAFRRKESGQKVAQLALAA